MRYILLFLMTVYLQGIRVSAQSLKEGMYVHTVKLNDRQNGSMIFLRIDKNNRFEYSESSYPGANQEGKGYYTLTNKNLFLHFDTADGKRMMPVIHSGDIPGDSTFIYFNCVLADDTTNAAFITISVLKNGPFKKAAYTTTDHSGKALLRISNGELPVELQLSAAGIHTHVIRIPHKGRYNVKFFAEGTDPGVITGGKLKWTIDRYDGNELILRQGVNEYVFKWQKE